MRLQACDCRVEHYCRGHRTWWMRLVPNRRLFRCYGCDAVMFIDPKQVAARLAEQSKNQRTNGPRPPADAVLHRY